jgi:FtsH-binding integral membrane protein
VELIAMMFGQKYTWLLIIGVFWLASILANKWSFPKQINTIFRVRILYFTEAVIFLPLLYMAVGYSGGGTVIFQAAMLTIAMFAGLSLVAFTSKKIFLF